MTNAVCTWDFTCYEVDHLVVKTRIAEISKKWVFQQEECPTTGRLHFQGRLSLKQKERLTGLKKKLPGWHLGITSNENKDNDFYVTKEETRVNGPWSSADIERFIPRQVREITELRPWQQHVIDDADVWNTRTINIVIDNQGNNGKSTLCQYAGVYGKGRKIPFSNDFKDIMRMVMDMPESKLYLFDIPRAIRKDQLYQFYAGVEEIKGGYAWDDRYKFREKWFNSPNIWIFTNTMPDRSLLSADRWKIWSIIGDNLIEIRENHEPAQELIMDDFKELQDNILNI